MYRSVRKMAIWENQEAVNWKTIEPNQWKPEKDGDFLIGILVRKEPKTPDLSAKYTFDTVDGMMMVWGSTILDDRLALVNIGDRVRVTFKGLTKNQKNQDLKLFKVEVADNTPQQPMTCV